MQSKFTLALLAILAAVPSLAAEPTVRTVYLVRHGAYLPSRQADPKLGPGLSTLGIAQARLTGARFRAIPHPIATITSSTMTRARETAAVIYEDVPNAKTASSESISECTPPAAFALRESEAELNACKQKLDAAFAQFFQPARDSNRHDVMVAHGNVIRYFVMKALGTDTRAWPNLGVKHASITIIEVHGNGAFQLVAMGDTGHIPANLQSWGDDADPNFVTPDVSGF
jgi:serine/threonine-protein phosphatase PGAM5